MGVETLKQRIEQAYQQRGLLEQESHRAAVFEAIALLDQGRLRVCEPLDGQWVTHAWVKQAILLYFGVTNLEESRPSLPSSCSR